MKYLLIATVVLAASGIVILCKQNRRPPMLTADVHASLLPHSAPQENPVASNQPELSVAATYPSIEDYLHSALPQHDSVLTWTNYTRLGQEGAACYYLDGQSLGVGHSGVANLLKTLTSMPAGKTLLVYPSYAVQRLFTQNSPLDIPFRATWRELQQIADARGIHLILIDRKIDVSIETARK